MDADEPAGMTDSLGAAGVCPPVEWQGKVYRLGHPTRVARADFEVGVVEAEKRAIAAQVRHGLLNPAEAAAEKSKLGARLDRGDHKTGKPLWLAYVFGDPETGDTSRVMTGLLVYVHTLFRQNHPEMTFADAQAIWDGANADVTLAMRQVVGDFFAWAAGAMALPPEAVAEVVGKVKALFPAPATPTTPTPTSPS